PSLLSRMCRGTAQPAWARQNSSPRHRSQSGTGRSSSPHTAHPSTDRYSASSSLDACQRHSKGRLLGLDTVEDHANHAAQIFVLGFATLHEPAEHILILAAEQLAIAPLVFLVQLRIDLFDEGHQQHIQLQHAATTLPEQTIEFRLFNHANAP